MAQHTETKYSCDKCDKKLPTFSNHIEIVTPLHGYDVDGSNYWSRLVVKIEHHHGYHNDGKEDKAELCQKCTIRLLEDALNRIKKGERLSAGVETSKMLKFNEPF